MSKSISVEFPFESKFFDSKGSKQTFVDPRSSRFFGVSVVTIHHWKRKRTLVGFKKIGKRVYLLERDCLKCMEDIERN